MARLRSSLFGLTLVAFLFGCEALQSPTGTAPWWIQLGDRISGVEKKLDGTIAKTATPDPSGGAIPAVTAITGVIGLLWYGARKLAGSVPAEVHQASIAAHAEATEALANSTPTIVTGTIPIPPKE